MTDITRREFGALAGAAARAAGLAQTPPRRSITRAIPEHRRARAGRRPWHRRRFSIARRRRRRGAPPPRSCARSSTPAAD